MLHIREFCWNIWYYIFLSVDFIKDHVEISSDLRDKIFTNNYPRSWKGYIPSSVQFSCRITEGSITIFNIILHEHRRGNRARFIRMQPISGAICDPSSLCNISRRFDALTASWLTPFRIPKTLGGNLVLVMKLRRSRESSLKPDQDVLMRGNFDFNLNTIPATCVASGRGNLYRCNYYNTLANTRALYWRSILRSATCLQSANDERNNG